jgi:hypothetical protein
MFLFVNGISGYRELIYLCTFYAGPIPRNPLRLPKADKREGHTERVSFSVLDGSARHAGSGAA